MFKPKPRTGELTTTYLGLTKPTVGASDDQWGGYINGDLDIIDTTVKGVSDVANAAYPASNPAGYITAVAIPAPYVLPVSSTTVLGGVKVDGTTIKAAGDGTISTTVVPLGDNRIINGDMRIDQRNGGAATTPGNGVIYAIDRWATNPSIGGKFSVQRFASSGGFAGGGFGYYLQFISTSAYTAPATETYHVQQPIEADYIADFMWGGTTPQPVTLSFWTFSSLTGTFSGCLANGATRAYPFIFSIPVSNTWTKIAITIPGDTVGPWTLQGNTTGLYVRFNLGAGANFLGPANAWASANYVGASGSVGVIATSGASFAITGVKLEVGTVATPFNRQSLARSMADCQRYYQTAQLLFQGQAGSAAQNISVSTMLPVVPRAALALTLSASSNVNLGAVTLGNLLGGAGIYALAPSVAAGAVSLNVAVNVNAEL